MTCRRDNDQTSISRWKQRMLLLGCLLFAGTFPTAAADGEMEFYDPASAPASALQRSNADVTNVDVFPNTPLLTIPARFYGLNIHPGSARHELAKPALIKAIKPDSIRIMTRMRVDWIPGQGRRIHLLSPSPGVYQWNELDALVDKIDEIGAEPYLALGFGPPHWLTSGSDPAGRLPPRRDALEAYASFMADIVERYAVTRKIPVRAVSVDNEPENVRYAMDDYMRLTRLAKAKIKAVAPKVLVGGPVTGYAQWKEADGSAHGFGSSLQRMKDGNTPFEFIDWHIYSTNPETILETVRTVQRTYGKDMPLYISELNRDWRYSGPDFEKSKRHNTSWESVAWLAYVYDHLQRAGVERSYYFAWRENALGLVDGTQENVRPNYYLFWAMTNHLGRKRVSTRVSEPDVGSIATLDAGKLAVLVYNQSQQDTYVAVRGIAGRPMSIARFNRAWFDNHREVGSTAIFPRFDPAADLSGRRLKLAAGGFLILKEN